MHVQSNGGWLGGWLGGRLSGWLAGRPKPPPPPPLAGAAPLACKTRSTIAGLDTAAACTRAVPPLPCFALMSTLPSRRSWVQRVSPFSKLSIS